MLLDYIQPRLVQLGSIKCGGKSQKELLTYEAKKQGLSLEDARGKGMTWRPPEKYDFFIVTTMNRNTNGQLVEDEPLMAELKKHYADKDGKLRRIPVRFLSNDLHTCLQSSLCWYGGKRIGARSELTFTAGRLRPGEITWFNDPKTGKPLSEPKTEPWKDEMLELSSQRQGKLLKVHTCLNVAIASTETKFGGVYRFRTTSQISTSQLYGGVLGFLEQTGGILVGLPFQLALRPMQVNPADNNGKRVSSVVYVAHIELLASDLKQIQDQAMLQARYQLEFKKEMSASIGSYRRMLAAPGHEEDAVEIADLNQEFQPDEEAEVREPVQMPRAVGEPPPVQTAPPVESEPDFMPDSEPEQDQGDFTEVERQESIARVKQAIHEASTQQTCGMILDTLNNKSELHGPAVTRELYELLQLKEKSIKPATITQDQRNKLSDEIDKRVIDLNAFLAKYLVKNLEDLPAMHFIDALTEVQKMKLRQPVKGVKS